MLCYNCMREKGDQKICPYCNCVNLPHTAPHQLPPGTIVGGRYTLGRVLGEGGFGITYIGLDNLLDLRVAVKEYFPYGITRRVSTVSRTVTVGAGEQQAFFDKGKIRFLREAKTIARFQDEPGIVKVSDFIEENNTAYIVMGYLDGIDLRQYLRQHGDLTVEQAFKLLTPVIKSLDKIHQAGVIHRDISPDNLMVLKDGSVKLMDFGAARDFSSDNRSMSVMLKKGYAPEEQYHSNGEQGPWTDVYGICATFYRCITGRAPDESLDRAYEDHLKKPSELGVDITPEAENVLMQGLAVKSEDRIRSMKDLYRLMEYALQSRSTVRAPQERTPAPKAPARQEQATHFANENQQPASPAGKQIYTPPYAGGQEQATRLADETQAYAPPAGRQGYTPPYAGAQEQSTRPAGEQRLPPPQARVERQPPAYADRSRSVVQAQPVSFVQQQSSGYDSGGDAPKPKKKAGVIILLIVILAVVGIGIFLLFKFGVFESDKEEHTSSSVPSTSAPVETATAAPTEPAYVATIKFFRQETSSSDYVLADGCYLSGDYSYKITYQFDDIDSIPDDASIKAEFINPDNTTLDTFDLTFGNLDEGNNGWHTIYDKGELSVGKLTLNLYTESGTLITSDSIEVAPSAEITFYHQTSSTTDFTEATKFSTSDYAYKIKFVFDDVDSIPDDTQIKAVYTNPEGTTLDSFDLVFGDLEEDSSGWHTTYKKGDLKAGELKLELYTESGVLFAEKSITVK